MAVTRRSRLRHSSEIEVAYGPLNAVRDHGPTGGDWMYFPYPSWPDAGEKSRQSTAAALIGRTSRPGIAVHDEEVGPTLAAVQSEIMQTLAPEGAYS